MKLFWESNVIYRLNTAVKAYKNYWFYYGYTYITSNVIEKIVPLQAL